MIIMLQVLVPDEEIQSKMLPTFKYTCIDYDTLTKKRLYGSEILRNTNLLGLTNDKQYVVQSYVPYGVYKSKDYRVVAKPDRVIIERDRKSYVLIICKSSDCTLNLQDKTILTSNNKNINVSQFFVRPDNSLYLVLYTGGTRIRVNINYSEEVAEVKVGQNIYVVSFMTLKQVLACGGV